jgi:hypothetical protein
MNVEQDDDILEFENKDWKTQEPEPGLWQETWEVPDSEFMKQLRQELNKINNE